MKIWGNCSLWSSDKSRLVICPAVVRSATRKLFDISEKAALIFEGLIRSYRISQQATLYA
jgi:hypothetical protein